MDPIHRFLAYGAIASIAIGVGWSVLLTVSGRPGGPRFERFQAIVVAVLIVGTASGLLLLMSGARPAEGLHLLYSAMAIAIIPLARSFLLRARGRGVSAFLLVAFVVLGAIVYRLFTTG